MSFCRRFYTVNIYMLQHWH